MPESPHIDSPIITTFLRTPSIASISALSRVVEKPKKQETTLDSSGIMSPTLGHANNHSTFFDSNSNTATSVSISSPRVSPTASLEQFPFYLSLESLGFESDSDDWTEGWDIQDATAIDVTSEQTRLFEVGELPVIDEGEFNYIPNPVKVRSHGSDNASDRSLRLARSRLDRQRRRVRYGMRFKLWFEMLLKKLGWTSTQ
jgi:hypothetical protein